MTIGGHFKRLIRIFSASINRSYLLSNMSKRNRPDEEDEVVRRGKVNKDKDWEKDRSDDALIEIETNENGGSDDDDMGATGDGDLVANGLIANLRINTSNKTRSSHPIWDMFGKLEKGGKVIAKAKERIFCVHCFQKKKMKR